MWREQRNPKPGPHRGLGLAGQRGTASPNLLQKKRRLSDCTQRIGPALYTKNYGLFRCGCFLGECSLDDKLRGRLLLRQALGLSCKADVEAEEEEEDGPESSNVELQRFFVFGKFRIFVRATRNLLRNEKLRRDFEVCFKRNLISKEEEEEKEERLSDYLEIRMIADKQHPCSGQHGCFALLPYREGEVVCIYAGAVVNMDVGEYESYYNVDYSTQSAPERTSRMRVDHEPRGEGQARQGGPADLLQGRAARMLIQ